MPVKMYRSVLITCVFTCLSIVLLLFTTCDETSQDAESEPETLEFSIEPTEDLSFMINEAPSDFTWEFFSDHLIVSSLAEAEWNDEIVLSSFQIENGELVNRSTANPYETNSEELSSGLSTEEMFPGLVYYPGQTWVTGKRWEQADQWLKAEHWLKTDHWTPLEQWIPASGWKPTNIKDIALNEVDLSDNQSLLVVYAKLAENSTGREIITQPYGLIFTDEENPQETVLSNKIAFASDRDGDDEIFIMDADGSNQQKITDNSVSDFAPSISNDGTQISFVSDRDGAANLYVMDYDGSNIQQLTSSGANTVYSSWSPDDSKLLFDDQREGFLNIYTINTDGSNLQQLTSNSATEGASDWSPDGSEIVFASDRDGDYEIYLMDSSGSNVQQLTNNSTDDFCSPSAWSPDGSQITFSSERDGDADIFIMNSDGSGVTQLTDHSARDIYPSWSPDGNEIVFSTERDGQREVYKVNADGSGSPINLSSNNAKESFPFRSLAN